MSSNKDSPRSKLYNNCSPSVCRAGPVVPQQRGGRQRPVPVHTRGRILLSGHRPGHVGRRGTLGVHRAKLRRQVVDRRTSLANR